MTENEKHWMLRAMKVYGGSFVKNLSMAWMCADNANSDVSEKAFPSYVEKYLNMGKHLQEIEEDKVSG